MTILEFPKNGDGKKLSADERAKIISDAIAEIPSRMEIFEVCAKIAYKKFNILVANGFDRKQALEIVKEDLCRNIQL